MKWPSNGYEYYFCGPFYNISEKQLKRTTSWHWLLLPSNWCHDTRPVENGCGAHGKHSFYRTTLSLFWYFSSSCIALITQASVQMLMDVSQGWRWNPSASDHDCIPFPAFPAFSFSKNRWWVLIFPETLHPLSASLSLSRGVVLKDRHPLLCVSCCGFCLDACFL